MGSLRGERTKCGPLCGGEGGRGKLVGKERLRNGLPSGTSGAKLSWLEADEVFFFFFSVARVGGGARGPDAVLVPDVQALVVPKLFLKIIPKSYHLYENL